LCRLGSLQRATSSTIRCSCSTCSGSVGAKEKLSDIGHDWPPHFTGRLPSVHVVQLHQPGLHRSIFEVERRRLKDIGTEFFPCLPLSDRTKLSVRFTDKSHHRVLRVIGFAPFIRPPRPAVGVPLSEPDKDLPRIRVAMILFTGPLDQSGAFRTIRAVRRDPPGRRPLCLLRGGWPGFQIENSTDRSRVWRGNRERNRCESWQEWLASLCAISPFRSS
jgi:hypothetical protein